MPAPGASYADGEIAFAFALVFRNDVLEKIERLAEQLVCLGLGEDEVADF